MNQAPPEIYAHIFSYACTDSGYTGRSLSLVSKYFHEVSKPAILQSIALYGRAQILAFAALLDQTPPHLRTTRALLINGRCGCARARSGLYIRTHHISSCHIHHLVSRPRTFRVA
ncbi:hypothetical protein C8J57DRAFT_1078181 [Mycena rebaudengoi]|nr:hypothetical protein C8J57DRAFT_1078181 [Mycena rebaudengoi]